MQTNRAFIRSTKQSLKAQFWEKSLYQRCIFMAPYSLNLSCSVEEKQGHRLHHHSTNKYRSKKHFMTHAEVDQHREEQSYQTYTQ
jgi:hypothetical protein